MRRFSPNDMTFFGLLAAVGVCAMLGVAGVTLYAVVDSRSQPAASVTQSPPLETQAATTIAPNTDPAGHIVFTCFLDNNDDLCLMNADGSNWQRLTAEDGTDWYASLASDGLTIAFSSRRAGSFQGYLMDNAGTNVRLLTTDLGDIYAPEISPDGTRMVFVSTVNGHQDIYTMALDGSRLMRITDDPAQDIDPTWSPDGRIAFTSNRSGTNEIYVVNADGSNVRQVTRGGDQREGGRTDWSPDGETIAFYAGERGDKNLFTVPAACAEEPQPCGPDRITRLTDGGNNKAPSFSPDGQWITFASELDGDNEIWIMRLDGSGLTQLTFNDYADWQPRWGP